jgi:hypothetical protein
MQKSVVISFFLVFLFLTNVNSIEWRTNDWQTNINEKIRDEFKSSKKMILPLEDGDWTLIDKDFENVYATIKAEELLFVQFDEQTPIAYFSIGRIDNLGKWVAYISPIIQAAVFKPKSDGCRERQHYNYLKFYKKGFAHNCMIATMLDVKRELFPSDSDGDEIFSASLRNYLKKNNVKMPDLYLEYSGTFHSMAVRPAWYVISYGVTPETFANYKPKFTSRDTTEFHPDKIENFPEAKKIMEKWLKKSAQLHKSFEDFQTVKKYQKLDLSDILPQNYKSKNNNKKGSVTKELIKLNELYKSGALTKEEFERAKKKVLK